MKHIFKKAASLVLSAVMMSSAFAISANAATNSASLADSYGLPENTSDGAILHAWCWSFNTIKAHLADIASAGFNSVQTSPINRCVVGEDGGMELMGDGKWYYHYQPTLYTIGNYQLGTLEEFKSLCAEAEKYGINIIVDVVANHCSVDYSAISNEIKNIPGGAFHDGFGISTYTSRYQVTQGQLSGLWDLNTQNPNVQQMILKYLKECVAAGADGFRYDAAKHIELPDETPEDGKDFSGNFWPTVLDNGAKFQYGEVLQGGDRAADYSKYINITAAQYGETLREALRDGSLKALKLNKYEVKSVDSSKLVTWVESHDNYCSDGTWEKLDNTDIRYGWAVIAAQGDTTPLFFSRPNGSSTTNQWGKNKIGEIGDDNFMHPEVTSVNHFKNAMVGESKNLVNPLKTDRSVLMIERGTKGAVIINTSDKDITADWDTNVANGSYIDEVTGNSFSVKNGKLSGTIKANSIAVVYNPVIEKQPSVSISQKGGTFRNSVELTLSAAFTDTATYKIGNSKSVEFKNGDTLTLGKEVPAEGSVDVTIYGKNAVGEVSYTYTFTRLAKPVIGVSQEGGNFRGTLELTLTADYADNAAYTLNGSSAKSFKSGDTITIGNGMKSGDELILTINASNSELSDSAQYTFTKLSAPVLEGETVVYFDNTKTQWKKVNIYAYDGEGSENKAWPGKKMTSLGDNIYAYVIDETWNQANVMFNNNQGVQFPAANEPGLVINKGEKKIFNGHTLEDYVVPVEVNYGDVNGDGSVNLVDRITLTRYLAKWDNIKNFDEKSADVNNDGTVNIADRMILTRYLAKWNGYENLPYSKK